MIDRLEQRVAADFAFFTVGRRHNAARSMRRLAAHLAAEARSLHALGSFTVTIELSPAAANDWLMPEDADPADLPEGWVDALYTNRLARPRRLERGLAAMAGMLRPGGVLVADLPADASMAFAPALLRQAGLDLVEHQALGILRGLAWQRAVLVRRLPG